MLDDTVWEAQKNMSWVINEVEKRGWHDTELEMDEFAELRRDHRFWEAQVALLYEEYFLPERHEFEWQLLSEAVKAVINAPAVQATGAIIVSGVVGNAAYDLLKAMCHFAANRLEEKLGPREEGRNGFIRLEQDIAVLQAFFAKIGRGPD